MIINNLNEIPENIKIVIAGSGPAGISLALSLEKKGIKSLIIESGDEFYTEISQDRYNGEVEGNFPNDLNVLRLAQFGGTTGHWGGTCRPLDVYDIKSWPLNIKELSKYQVEACNFLKIKNQFREKKITENLKIIEFQDSPVRVYDDYFDKIKHSNNVYLSLNTFLYNIKLNENKIEKIFLKKKGKNFELSNKLLVLACGGIENSRLLLWFSMNNSNFLKDSPVGNYWMEHPYKIIGSGVGNFKEIRKIFKNDFYFFENFRNWGNYTVSISPSYKMINQYKMLNSGVFLTLHDRDNNNLKNNIKDLLCVAPKLSKKFLELFNKDLLCGLTVSSSWEQDPEFDNKILLTKNLDDIGMPRVKLKYKLSDKSLKTAQNMVLELGNFFIDNNLGRIAGENIYDENVFISDAGYHHIGGTIMGSDSKKSVVDKNLKIHLLNNMFVVGSSVFPTGGHANPTLSIVKLSLKLSDHIEKIFKNNLSI